MKLKNTDSDKKSLASLGELKSTTSAHATIAMVTTKCRKTAVYNKEANAVGFPSKYDCIAFM